MLPLSAARKSSLLHAVQQHLARGDLAQARATLDQLIRAEPQRADLAFQMSRICFELGDRAATLDHLRRALQLSPDDVRLQQSAAERFRHLGCAEEALALYDRRIAADPRAIKPQADKAHYLQLLGRFAEAETIFRALIRRHPAEAELYRIFLATQKLPAGDPLIRAMEQLWARRDLPEGKRLHLGYALAKAMEDTGQFDRVFPYLHRANALQARAAPFDEAAQDREFAAVLAAQQKLAPLPDSAGAPLRPILVTGMPRSGTTLVERILAAHSGVSAGGELGHALKLAYHLYGAGEAMRPIAPGQTGSFAQRYLTLAARDTDRSTGAFTDKSILCHLIFGLMAQSLPGARIVVVLRDPRDVAVSIYKNHFTTGTHRYATDLAMIAGAIKRFRRSLRHWQDRMPDRLHLLRYEDLVRDPEPQSRALVAAAGLDWEDACLSSHRTTGAVRTLSVAQARAPIHAGAAQGWTKYASELAPFFDAWGDETWD
ncbi:sulfotransferase [Salipiger marinus]|uniref:Sulfotransferase family protein n=1 Tax=Salipiger marinus TaxID=555512 RepID=A0A1G8I172_9RHOB|nr:MULTISPECIES: sulfotransferase [Salipiger]MEB3417115.1 sulfotransferase [Salipiger manganoxidans]SDI12706.1 Sulfotransferase family protein [Salipiger marinus]